MASPARQSAGRGRTSRPVRRVLWPRPPRGGRGGGHPSGTGVATGLVRSTRGLGRVALEHPRRAASRPLLTLLRMGFTEPPRSPWALVVSYTTVSPLPDCRPKTGPAVCFLWHCPAGHPGWALPTILPCGARTFLGEGARHPRRGRPAGSSAVCPIVPAARPGGGARPGAPGPPGTPRAVPGRRRGGQRCQRSSGLSSSGVRWPDRPRVRCRSARKERSTCRTPSSPPCASP